MNTSFSEAYLRSLNLIKQEETTQDSQAGTDSGEGIDVNCNGNCDQDKPLDNEAKKDDQEETPADEKEVITGDTDGEDADDAEADDASDDEGSDDAEGEEGQEQGDDDSEEATCFCFKTINKDLIDIINSGFDKVVFTVKATDDDGKDTTTDIEISADAFEDFGECEEDEPADEGQGDDLGLDDLPEDGIDDDITDDEFGDVEGDAAPADEEGSDDEEDTSFESVFKKYYGALVGEAKK